MNLLTGVISLSRSVYGKANSIIPMVISAQDGGGLVALISARVNISVVAGLVAPPVFDQTQYFFTVCEDVLRGTVVGVVQASSKTGGTNAYKTNPSLIHHSLDINTTAHTEQFRIHLSVTLDHEQCVLFSASCTTCTNRHRAIIHT